MTKILYFIIAMLYASSGYVWSEAEGEAAPSPLTNNNKYYIDGEFQSKYYAHVGAVSGELIQREPGPEGRPLLLLKLDEVEKSLWVASVKKADESLLDLGDSLMVLGFFDRTELETEYIQKVNESPEYMLGFCFIVQGSGLPIYSHQYLDKCKEWENGTLAELELPHTKTAFRTD